MEIIKMNNQVIKQMQGMSSFVITLTRSVFSKWQAD